MIEIRPSAEEDLDWICALEEENFALPWTRGQLANEIYREGAVLLTARLDGHCAGYMGMDYVLDEGYVTNVCTSSAHRRCGVAGALIDAMLDKARGLGLSFVTLEVRVSNAPARALYAKKGFQEVGIRPGYYEKPREDAAIMTFYIDKGAEQ